MTLTKCASASVEAKLDAAMARLDALEAAGKSTLAEHKPKLPEPVRAVEVEHKSEPPKAAELPKSVPAPDLGAPAGH